MEPGESLEAALARELREELGVAVLEARFWRTVDHEYPQRSVRLHFFHIDAFSGEPAPREGQAMRWLTPCEARELPFLEADRPLLCELAPFAASTQRIS